MSAVLDGATQFISVASAIVTAYPFSAFAYFNPNNITAANYLFSADASGSATVNGWRMRAAGEVAGDPVRGTTGDGSATDAYSTSTSYAATTWQKGLLVATSATSRSVFLNNGGVGTTATNLTPTGQNRTLIGVTALQAVFSGWFAGSLAHAAIWNVALSTQDRNMLQAGISPKNVAKDNLKAYLPLWDSGTALADLFAATVWVNNGAFSYGADPGIKFNNNNMMMGMS